MRSKSMPPTQFRNSNTEDCTTRTSSRGGKPCNGRKDFTTTRGCPTSAKANHPAKVKRGLVQAPFFELTPQKTGTESRFGSGHPGKPIS